MASLNSPGLLPTLGQGCHHLLEDGACLMEYVSVLSGDGFTDRPWSTHPALGELARRVNDATTDHGRARLALLAPNLIGTNVNGAGSTAAVVAACLRAAGVSSRSKHVERFQRWPAGVAVGCAFRLVARQMCRISSSERDVGLYDLLADAIANCRQLLDGPLPRFPRSPRATVLDQSHDAGFPHRTLTGREPC